MNCPYRESCRTRLYQECPNECADCDTYKENIKLDEEEDSRHPISHLIKCSEQEDEIGWRGWKA